MGKAKAPEQTDGSGKNRTNLFIEITLLQELDYIAGMQFSLSREKTTRTDIVNKFLKQGVDAWKKKHGEIPLK